VCTHPLIAEQLADTGISASQVGRTLADLALHPHRVRGWLNRAGNDQVWARAGAVCDMYLHPPAGTVGLHPRENRDPSQVPHLPERAPGPRRPPRRECEYVRNGTVSIIAALQVATGQVIVEPISRNDSVTFTGFLHRLDQCIDPSLKIHLITDNVPPTPPAPPAWLAAHPGSASPTPPFTPPGWTWPTVVLGADPGPAAPRGVHLPPRPQREDHQLGDPLQPDRQTVEVVYDARADHDRYRARHNAQHPTATTNEPATGQPTPRAA
jgi:hypothetical protein